MEWAAHDGRTGRISLPTMPTRLLSSKAPSHRKTPNRPCIPVLIALSCLQSSKDGALGEESDEALDDGQPRAGSRHGACGTAAKGRQCRGENTRRRPRTMPIRLRPMVRHYLSQPLVRDIFTADPSAHVWSDGKLYIYPAMTCRPTPERRSGQPICDARLSRPAHGRAGRQGHGRPRRARRKGRALGVATDVGTRRRL